MRSSQKTFDGSNETKFKNRWERYIRSLNCSRDFHEGHSHTFLNFFPLRDFIYHFATAAEEETAKRSGAEMCIEAVWLFSVSYTDIVFPVERKKSLNSQSKEFDCRLSRVLELWNCREFPNPSLPIQVRYSSIGLCHTFCV